MGRRANLRGPSRVLRLGLRQSEGCPTRAVGRLARRKRRFMESCAGRVRNLGVDHRGIPPLLWLRDGMSANPALATPTPDEESWWCEACVRRTLQAIEESRQAPENEA